MHTIASDAAGGPYVRWQSRVVALAVCACFALLCVYLSSNTFFTPTTSPKPATPNLIGIPTTIGSGGGVSQRHLEYLKRFYTTLRQGGAASAHDGTMADGLTAMERAEVAAASKDDVGFLRALREGAARVGAAADSGAAANSSSNSTGRVARPASWWLYSRGAMPPPPAVDDAALPVQCDDDGAPLTTRTAVVALITGNVSKRAKTIQESGDGMLVLKESIDRYVVRIPKLPPAAECAPRPAGFFGRLFDSFKRNVCPARSGSDCNEAGAGVADDEPDSAFGRPAFIAMIADTIPDAVAEQLHTFGWGTVRVSMPFDVDKDVRNHSFARDLKKDGAMGPEELLKLEPLQWGAAFDEVLELDIDIVFHSNFALLERGFVSDFLRLKKNPFVTSIPPPPPKGRPALAPPLRRVVHAADLPYMTEGRTTLSTKDNTRVFFWTHGGWAATKANGGYYVFRPHGARGRLHYQNMMELVMEGDYRLRGAWRGSGIGETYGGRTNQGLLPFYFFYYHPLMQEAARRKMACRKAEQRQQSDGAPLPRTSASVLLESAHSAAPVSAVFVDTSDLAAVAAAGAEQNRPSVDFLVSASAIPVASAEQGRPSVTPRYVRFFLDEVLVQAAVETPAPTCAPVLNERAVTAAADHQELERCMYNNMNQPGPCTVMPSTRVRSTHFTGGKCPKPWHMPNAYADAAALPLGDLAEIVAVKTPNATRAARGASVRPSPWGFEPQDPYAQDATDEFPPDQRCQVFGVRWHMLRRLAAKRQLNTTVIGKPFLKITKK